MVWIFVFFAFFEPVQVLRLPGLVFLHFFEPVQVLEPWVLKTCTGSKKCKKSKPGSSKTCTGSKKYKKCKTQMQVRGQGLIGLEFCSFCVFLSLWPALMPLRNQAIEVMSALLINQMLTGRYNSAAVMTHTHNHQPFRTTCPNHIKQGLK